jgi:hypothetical protein
MGDSMGLHRGMSMAISYRHRQLMGNLGFVEIRRKIAWEVDMGMVILEGEAGPQVAIEVEEDQDMAEEALIPTCVVVMVRLDRAEAVLMVWWVLWQQEQWWEVEEGNHPDIRMVMEQCTVENHLAAPMGHQVEGQRLDLLGGWDMVTSHMVLTMAVTTVTVYLALNPLHQCQK